MHVSVQRPDAAHTSPISVAEATQADERAWETYVTAHPESTGYHSWGWQRVFKRAFGHDSIYLVAKHDGRIVGALPLVFIKSSIFGRSLTSMAFLNYGGIIADTEAVGRALLSAAADTARRLGCHHVELRHFERQFPDLPCREHKVTMCLPLEGVTWDTLDRKVRNQIRKAQKSELTAIRGGRELLDEFYAVFARNMRDLGTPVYSRRLFEGVLAQFPERAALHVVRLGSQAVAGGLTFRTDGRVEVPWASSVRDYNALCPNHLLYWSVIESAIGSGATLMDFGRSTPNEGTFKFKEQWGARPVPLHWEYVLPGGGTLPAIAAGNPKFRLMVEGWKRLPLSVASRLGPSIVRGIP